MRKDLGCKRQYFLRANIEKFNNPSKRFKETIFLFSIVSIKSLEGKYSNQMGCKTNLVENQA